MDSKVSLDACGSWCPCSSSRDDTQGSQAQPFSLKTGRCSMNGWLQKTTPWKFNIDTKNDCLEKGTPLKYLNFCVSMLNFRGVAILN